MTRDGLMIRFALLESSCRDSSDSSSMRLEDPMRFRRSMATPFLNSDARGILGAPLPGANNRDAFR
jgi:hypothetical protein